MKSRILAVVAGIVALAGAATGFLLSIQVLGPHGRSPRYGTAAARTRRKKPR